ncbi:MAG: phage tail protein [Desulfamplus sp.]
MNKEDENKKFKSCLIDYLPAIYRENEDAKDFLVRFLKIFEDTLTPISELISQIHFIFDPKLTPSQHLPYLARWMGSSYLNDFSNKKNIEQYRQLIPNLMNLYRKRGTKSFLEEWVRILTGRKITIEEKIVGMTLGDQTKMGWAFISDAKEHFVVWVDLPKIKEDRGEKEIGRCIKKEIDSQKPVFCRYVIKTKTNDGTTVELNEDILK